MSCMYSKQLTVNGLHGSSLISGLHVLQRLANHQGKLNLVVQVNATGANDRAGTGEQH